MNPREIEFQEVTERWNSYNLSDGTTLKLKIILIKVINDGNDSQGNQSFSLQTANVIGIFPSNPMNEDELKKKEEDVKILVDDVDWNEYNLKTYGILKLKPIIVQIDRTGYFDPKNLPVYMVQAQPLIKLKK